MHDQFERSDIDDRHVVRDSDDEVEMLVASILDRLDEGRLAVEFESR